MNAYDKQYEIRVAREQDIDAIMRFIEEHWKHGHIMATNREFFEYEFLEEDGTVNFILAIDRKKGTIECLNGFLKASHDPQNLDVWGSIWKVLDGNMGMLGAEVIRRRKELTHCRCDLDVGDNPNTAIPVLKVLLKRHTAKMRHYYILADRDDFRIASVRHRPKRRIGDDHYHVVALKDIEDVRRCFHAERFAEYTPYKDTWYIEHRFFRHPIYQYQVYGIERNPGVADAIMIFRNQEHQGRIAIRMVDYIGERSAISGIGPFLEDLLKQDADAEYIDFYCAGIDEGRILDAGFAVLSEEDENVIPNYFGPFLQKNIDIWVDSRDENSLFTKADADQDRPNAIPD